MQDKIKEVFGLINIPDETEFELFMVSLNWAGSGYPDPKNVLNEPMLGGDTLYSLLMADEIDHEKILFIGSRLAMKEPKKTLLTPFKASDYLHDYDDVKGYFEECIINCIHALTGDEDAQHRYLHKAVDECIEAMIRIAKERDDGLNN